MTEEKAFLPLGSIVILKGALKKLMIISRGSTLNNSYFDYGAILYPEGMIDENIAYFNQEDIIKSVQEGYTDNDDALMVDQLSQAKAEYLASEKPEGQVTVTETVIDASIEVADDDPFTAVRDMEDDE